MRLWLPPALGALLAGCAAAPTSLEGVDRDRIERAVAELTAVPELAGGRVGVVVMDAASGEVLAEHMADRGFATASNMKLVSSAVALWTLGAEYQARTELLQLGSIDDGVLVGDLLLLGRGDPTLPVGALTEFAAAVRDAGITRIAGRVRADGSWLGNERRGRGWQWDYLDAGYAAPFSALCLNGNCVRLTIHPGNDGRRLQVLREPRAEPAPDVDLELLPAGSRTRIRVARELGSDRITIAGEMARDSKPVVDAVAVRDPEAFAAAALRQALVDAGIEVADGSALAIADAERMTRRVLATRQAPALAAIVRPLLESSDNLYAEVVWRTAAREAGRERTTTGAARHTAEFFRRIGIDPTGAVFADGSGLSRRNLVQPRQLAEMLRWIDREAPFRAEFVAGLPVAGESGTLRRRFRSQPGRARGRVRAKTGFISRVVALSGYVERPDPDAAPLVFVALVNDFTCSAQAAKDAVDAFVEELAASVGWAVPAQPATP